MGKRKTLADHLRQAIADSGLSARKLGALTGISQQAVSLFIAGGDCKTGNAELLADALGMMIILEVKA